MASEKRHIGLFGVAGVLLAALIIAGFVFAGNLLAFGKGVLTINVMDKPVDLKSLFVTIDSIGIQGEDESWTDLPLKNNPSSFDLLTLQDTFLTLSETPVPAGDYVMIRMHIAEDPVATYLDDTPEVTADDPVKTLRVPSEEIKVLLTPHLHIEGGSQTVVLIDLQPENLSSIAISNSTSLNLRPVVRAVVSEP